MPRGDKRGVKWRGQRARRIAALVAGLLGVAGVVALGRALFIEQPPHDREAPSPNCDFRPIGSRIDCIVLHATAMTSAAAAIHHLRAPGSGVSAHFVIARDGTITQLVPVEMRAWHAGVSSLDGVPGVNDYSVGIELDNPNDGVTAYPERQMRALIRLVGYLRRTYHIPAGRIVSHAEIALPAGRKSDPLGLDFDRVRAETE